MKPKIVAKGVRSQYQKQKWTWSAEETQRRMDIVKRIRQRGTYEERRTGDSSIGSDSLLNSTKIHQ